MLLIYLVIIIQLFRTCALYAQLSLSRYVSFKFAKRCATKVVRILIRVVSRRCANENRLKQLPVFYFPLPSLQRQTQGSFFFSRSIQEIYNPLYISIFLHSVYTEILSRRCAALNQSQRNSGNARAKLNKTVYMCMCVCFFFQFYLTF